MRQGTLLTLLDSGRLAEHYRTGAWRDETIYGLLRTHAERAPDDCAIRDRARRLTYRALLQEVDAFAGDLARRGLRPGERVALWLPSGIEAAVTILACARNAYVCSPSFHRDHTVADAAALMERIRAAALVAQPGYGADAGRSDVFAATAALGSLRHAYRVTAGDAAAFAGLLGEPLATEWNRDPNRVIYLAFTSGTTGAPKGVMHSDNTLLATVRAVAKDWRLDRRTIVYTLSPLSHNLGIGALILAMTVGGELVIHDLPRGASLIDRLDETGATYLVGVPTHAIDLLAELRARGRKELGRVKGFRISGAAIPSEVVAALLAHGVVPQSGYGMTETCSHQYTLPDDKPERIIATSGRCCAGYEIRIFRQDDPDREMPVGEIGQIGGRGASLMLGYFDDQAATEDSFNAAGWFMTGDLGAIDEDGYLRVTGRKKDVIIRGGHNIYPARIEALAMRHEAVARAAAFPIADARLGEKVCLAVEFHAGRAATAEELLAHLDGLGLSRYDMPEYFMAIGALPLTASGKILKRELASRVERGLLTPAPVRWQARS
ncbi:MAG TPA: class I adenylate-forming enzyme family protein [Stellaceae bacterium]|nr:class I adenylate-forming enzyme family protein [Stellaceae bacterium]